MNGKATISPELRAMLEGWISQGVEILDCIDAASSDLEPDADLEGAADREPDGEDEPDAEYVTETERLWAEGAGS